MRRRDFLISAGATLTDASPAQPPALPNIVYVLADDLGWGDLRCYNAESAIPTPSADLLAKQGMRFTDMHSPSSVCTPTRYGIMTGRYCWRTRLRQGVLWGYDTNLIEPGRMTVPSLLKSRGYHTAGMGKWHLGLGSGERVDYTRQLRPSPVDHGFDHYFGIPASLDMEPYLYFENDRVLEQPTAHTPGRNSPRGVFWRPGPIAPSLRIEEVLPILRERASRYILERASRPEQPFFLYLALTSPHTPWLPSRRFRGRSRAGDYGDFVAETDDVLGSIMLALDKHGLADKTLLIFTSDNGADWTPQDKERFLHRANAAWRGQKRDIYEGGHRIPFIARWPGRVRAGSVSDQLGCLTDLLATAADITNTPMGANAGEDSFSLLPALAGTGARRPVRDAVVHHSNDGLFAIRQGRWKLVLGRGSGGSSKPVREEVKPGGPAGQLYDVAADPGELSDVYAREPDTVTRLTALLEKYQRDGRST
ncbi:MAG TPA: arylsulfatase [Bryobacteraceae bacterium]|nr:arylsulfatase [Bryobacteraceae bacterium]